jgi:hypothetical protein
VRAIRRAESGFVSAMSSQMRSRSSAASVAKRHVPGQRSLPAPTLSRRRVRQSDALRLM